MEPQFWHDRWELQQIGFHQPEINPLLVKHWSALHVNAGQVFVPLCGKTLDMHYFAQQGLQVLGNEFNATAVEQFFAESDLTPTITSAGELSQYQADNYQLLLGDFFALTPAMLADCTAFYDRGALVALPEAMRQRYAQHLSKIVPTGCKGLAVLLDYPQEQLAGPAFAVSLAWLTEHLGGAFEIEQIASYDVLAENGKFVKNGVSWLNENVFVLTRK